MKSILSRIGLYFTVLSISLLATETVLRAFFPIYTVSPIEAYQYDPEIGVRLKPDVHVFRRLDYQEETLSNKIGTVNFQESFKDYNQLIFAVGDSFTQGTGLPADASYPSQLDLILNMRNGAYIKKYAVVNLGQGSFGGEQSILMLTRHTHILGRPNYILYLGCDNDYNDDLLFRNGLRHGYIVDGSPYWGVWSKPLRWIANETEIGKRIKLVFGIVKRSLIPKTIARTHRLDRGISPSVAELEEPMLQKLLAVSKELGATLIVGWIDSPKELTGSYEWLKVWARDHNVSFADWYPLVKSVQNAIPNLPLKNQHSGRHFRTWANQLIAQAYAKHISN